MFLPEGLTQTLKSRTNSEVRFRKIDRLIYATDASNYRIQPLGVVIPRTAEDVAETVKIAAEFGVSIIPRGGGTGLAGQCLGEGIAVDMSKYMDGVVEINSENKTATVQPGICLGRLNAIAAEKGLMFGPDPASAKVATVGGVVANNGTGAHSILYGMAGDNVVSLRSVLHTGNEISFSKNTCADAELSRKLENFRNQNLSLVTEKFPKHWRRASGYSLNYLTDEDFNPAKLFASSEGTFGIATEITLKLVDKPRHTGLAVLQFDDLFRAIEAVPAILERAPAAVELIDKMLIGLTEKHGGFSRLLSFVKGNPAAVIAVEFFGHSADECSEKAAGLLDFLKQKGVSCEKDLALSAEDQSKVWGVRTAGLGLLMSSRSGTKPVPCIEDVSVPVPSLAPYVKDISSVFSSLGLEAGFYAHASAGCLHIRPLLDLSTRKGADLMEEVSDAALGLALKHGGVMSGEHGDGRQRSHLNKRLFGAEIYGAMTELKNIFDPADMFNPGNVVNSAAGVKDNLRNEKHGGSDLPLSLDWTADGGLSGAAAACNGQGFCRKTGEGAMCPSYIATRDEAHTTRARANLLRSVMNGDVEDGFLLSPEAEEVFSLCVGCKACKTECPSSVDVAKMKTEFLYLRGRKLGFSLADRVFSDVHKISSVLSRIPGANLFASSGASKLLSIAGIDGRREIPLFAPQRFGDWFSSRPKREPKEKKAIYFHDTWAEFFNPGAGRGAVEILESLGYEVLIEKRRVCCGRPMISRGMIDKARRNAELNTEILRPYAEKGFPIVGTEPSCVSMFTDDYADLLPGSPGQKAVARSFLTIEDFVKREAETLAPMLEPGSEPVIAHTHCHSKAAEPDSGLHSVLNSLGFDCADSGAGCCGMAGGFGYEKKNRDVSEKIAGDRLVPAIEKHGGRVCATGISCMEQIRHFTRARPLHFAELVAGCLKKPAG
ncbi:MAG: FAD-binding and (Fe-S)-binding domain-containing protein [Thermodesulfobacteriota bacterium]